MSDLWLVLRKFVTNAKTVATVAPSSRAIVPKRALRRSRRGQAMIEYSVVAYALLISTMVAGWPFISYMMNALTKYYESISFVITSPVP